MSHTYQMNMMNSTLNSWLTVSTPSLLSAFVMTKQQQANTSTGQV